MDSTLVVRALGLAARFDERNGTGYQTRVAERRQTDQPDAVFIARHHALGDGKGDRSLADPAGSDDRHQSLA